MSLYTFVPENVHAPCLCVRCVTGEELLALVDDLSLQDALLAVPTAVVQDLLDAVRRVQAVLSAVRPLTPS